MSAEKGTKNGGEREAEPEGVHDAEWNAARRAWPTVNVPLDAYSAYVRARTSTASGEGHGAPRWADLYLACACDRGDPAALQAFEDAFFGEIPRVLSRLRGRAWDVDETRQLVRARLFAGPTAKIREYSGRGDLKGWFRVVTLRVVLNASARKTAEVPLEDHALTFLGPDPDPEIEYMKQLYRAEFVAAFGEAAASLDDEDRALLRQAFVEGLTVDLIGESLGVHRATAARWVKRAYARLVKALHASLRRRLQLSDADYDSVLRLIASRLELSLAQYLHVR